jgi:hypothetical protein
MKEVHGFDKADADEDEALLLRHKNGRKGPARNVGVFDTKERLREYLSEKNSYERSKYSVRTLKHYE